MWMASGLGMARRVSMATRTELVSAIGERSRRSGRIERSSILNEFVAVTGYHRKHAIRLLTKAVEVREVAPRRAGHQYGAEVQAALIVLWETSDRVCSKRLKPLIPVCVSACNKTPF